MLSCGIYFLPFWMKRIHCNTKQTLWLNGRNISKTLLSWNHCLNFAVFRFWLGLVRAFLVWRRFAVSLVRISTRKMMQLRKLSTSWTMISFFTKTSTASIGLTIRKSKSNCCSNINKSAFPLSTGIFYTSLQSLSAYWHNHIVTSDAKLSGELSLQIDKSMMWLIIVLTVPKAKYM